MSKVSKTVAKVASVVAVVAAVAAVVTGNPILAAKLLKISAAAGAVGAVAGTVAQMTAKKPPARGSPNLITIAANQPMPIVLGETYIGGNKVHEVGYGGLVSKVENPYKFQAIIHSGCGPVQAITGLYADFESISLSGTSALGHFAGFLYADQQLGARPEADALSPNWAGAPDWGASHKLSGYAATGLSLKFDRNGKVFASGEPQWGVTMRGVKSYDPRLDSTYPGGSGSCRITDRATWVYSENPGIVGLTYCYGWHHDGKKQGGIGMPVEGIEVPRWVEFANICDANGWKVGGVIYEPASRWDNLKDICAAGGGEPYFDRHLLGVNYNAPRVSLDTITADDIADDGFTVASGRTWRERINTIAPKFRSAAHKWEYLPSADVSVSQYVTDDGEEKREELTWNLVQNKDQVAQLSAYELVNRREIGQIEVSCKPRLMRYTVGDMLTFDLPNTVIDGLDAVIIRPPEIDPESGRVKLIMMGETDAKHDFALGKVGTAPPVPTLVNPSRLDELAISLAFPPSTQSPEAAPTEPVPGHIYINGTGRKFRFDGRQLLFGGIPLTFNGDPIYTSGYVDAQDQATVQALADAATADAAAAAAQNVATIAQGLANDAQATADGKVRTFYQASAPVAEGVGDIWFDTDDGNKQYRWSGSSWLAVRDAGIGQAITDAAGAQATADGKVTTFVGETSPTAEALGDLWFKASVGELRRWSGSAWGNPLVDLTAAKQVTIVPPVPQIVYRDWLGNVKDSQYSRTLTPKVERGGVDIRTSNDVSYAITTTGTITATVNNTTASADKGRITATAGSNGSILLTITVSGVAQPVFTIPFTNEDDAAPTTSFSGNAGGSDSTLEDVTSTSFAAITQQDGGESVFLIDITSGQTLNGTAPLTYQKSGTNTTSTAMVARWQYRLQGSGTWLDFVAGPTNVTGTGSYWIPSEFEAVQGDINANQSKSGLAAGTYECQLIAAKSNSAAGNLQIVSGAATVSKS